MACKWINGEFSRETKYKETIGKIQKTLHTWWKGGVASPISNIDSFVKHVNREHNQEADHWADTAHGWRKIIIDKRVGSTTWKAIRGFWDGSFKDNGGSGCGFVIKGVDREKWVTISNVAERPWQLKLQVCACSRVSSMVECSKRQPPNQSNLQ